MTANAATMIDSAEKAGKKFTVRQHRLVRQPRGPHRPALDRRQPHRCACSRHPARRQGVPRPPRRRTGRPPLTAAKLGDAPDGLHEIVWGGSPTTLPRRPRATSTGRHSSPPIPSATGSPSWCLPVEGPCARPAGCAASATRRPAPAQAGGGRPARVLRRGDPAPLLGWRESRMDVQRACRPGTPPVPCAAQHGKEGEHARR
jgi:hypothetical protein